MANSCFFNLADDNRLRTSKDSKCSPTKSTSSSSSASDDKSSQPLGKSVRHLREIVDKANCDFDRLVSQLMNKICSDHSEYHLMYHFVAR